MPLPIPSQIFTLAGRDYVRKLLPDMNLSFGADGFVNQDNGLPISDDGIIQVLKHYAARETIQITAAVPAREGAFVFPLGKTP